mmetsp:Transcript_6308/g.15713  ORF Transcript_6308/g.15713 Transcript_6308/m.15713 type:complete len:228 (+) Transcript_6308:360-1043(+)
MGPRCEWAGFGGECLGGEGPRPERSGGGARKWRASRNSKPEYGSGNREGDDDGNWDGDAPTEELRAGDGGRRRAAHVERFPTTRRTRGERRQSGSKRGAQQENQSEAICIHVFNGAAAGRDQDPQRIVADGPAHNVHASVGHPRGLPPGFHCRGHPFRGGVPVPQLEVSALLGESPGGHSVHYRSGDELQPHLFGRGQQHLYHQSVENLGPVRPGIFPDRPVIGDAL